MSKSQFLASFHHQRFLLLVFLQLFSARFHLFSRPCAPSNSHLDREPAQALQPGLGSSRGWEPPRWAGGGRCQEAGACFSGDAFPANGPILIHVTSTPRTQGKDFSRSETSHKSSYFPGGCIDPFCTGLSCSLPAPCASSPLLLPPPQPPLLTVLPFCKRGAATPHPDTLLPPRCPPKFSPHWTCPNLFLHRRRGKLSKGGPLPFPSSPPPALWGWSPPQTPNKWKMQVLEQEPRHKGGTWGKGTRLFLFFLIFFKFFFLQFQQEKENTGRMSKDCHATKSAAIGDEPRSVHPLWSSPTWCR